MPAWLLQLGKSHTRTQQDRSDRTVSTAVPMVFGEGADTAYT
jgi:hypothetical protein